MGWWTVSVQQPFDNFDKAMKSGHLVGWCNASIGKRDVDYQIDDRAIIYIKTEEKMVLFLLYWKDRL